jgi:hypothetical protein
MEAGAFRNAKKKPFTRGPIAAKAISSAFLQKKQHFCHDEQNAARTWQQARKSKFVKQPDIAIGSVTYSISKQAEFIALKSCHPWGAATGPGASIGSRLMEAAKTAAGCTRLSDYTLKSGPPGLALPASVSLLSLNGAASADEWLTIGRDPGGTRYSPLTQIDGVLAIFLVQPKSRR